MWIFPTRRCLIATAAWQKKTQKVQCRAKAAAYACFSEAGKNSKVIPPERWRCLREPPRVKSLTTRTKTSCLDFLLGMHHAEPPSANESITIRKSDSSRLATEPGSA